MMRRRGGLMRAAATTAVVAGTAGAVSHHQQQKYQQQAEAQAYEQQQQAAAYAPPPEAYAPPPAPPAAPVDPTVAQIQKLADLHTQGILSDEEFAAAKAKARHLNHGRISDHDAVARVPLAWGARGGPRFRDQPGRVARIAQAIRPIPTTTAARPVHAQNGSPVMKLLLLIRAVP